MSGYQHVNASTCEMVPECADITCFNGGTCYIDANNVAQCDCTAGYHGPQCYYGKAMAVTCIRAFNYCSE